MRRFSASLGRRLASGAAFTPVTLVMAVMAFVATPLLADDTADERRVCEMRVESELFAADGDQPVARSLTLFHEGAAWDFLELPSSRRGGSN